MSEQEFPTDRIVEGDAVVGYLPKICEAGWIMDIESDPNCLRT